MLAIKTAIIGLGIMGQRMQQDRINMLPMVPLSKGQLFKLIPEKAARCIQTNWRARVAQHAVQSTQVIEEYDKIENKKRR